MLRFPNSPPPPSRLNRLKHRLLALRPAIAAAAGQMGHAGFCPTPLDISDKCAQRRGLLRGLRRPFVPSCLRASPSFQTSVQAEADDLIHTKARRHEEGAADDAVDDADPLLFIGALVLWVKPISHPKDQRIKGSKARGASMFLYCS
jgi:hypothetical protein